MKDVFHDIPKVQVPVTDVRARIALALKKRKRQKKSFFRRSDSPKG